LDTGILDGDVKEGHLASNMLSVSVELGYNLWKRNSKLAFYVGEVDKHTPDSDGQTDGWTVLKYTLHNYCDELILTNH
jgi:hypothetical protein